MPAFYRYNLAIFGTQSTDGNGAAIDYQSEPTSGTWTYTGGQNGFVVEEANQNNTDFDGDQPDDVVQSPNRIGRGQAQTTEINGTPEQVLWDYTFEIRDPDTNETFEIGVIDVDLNRDNDVSDPGEAGYYLVFIDTVPTPGVTYELTGNITDARDIPHADLGGEVVCFAAGTMVETATGLRAIETLEAGDLVRTRDAGMQPLRWVGCSHAVAQGKLAPIVIRKGAIGNTSDLVVSPQHAVLVEDWRAAVYFGHDDVLVRAVDLLKHDGVYVRPGGIVRYYHLLFDAHHLVRASGIWSESLFPGEVTCRTIAPDARAEIETLFPNLKGYGPKSARCLRKFEAVCLTE